MRGEEDGGGRGRGKEGAAVAGGGGGGEGGDGGGQPGYTCRRPHLTFRLTFFRSGVFTRSSPAPPSLLSLSAPCLPCHLYRANGTVQGPLSTPGIWWTGIQPSLFFRAARKEWFTGRLVIDAARRPLFQVLTRGRRRGIPVHTRPLPHPALPHCRFPFRISGWVMCVCARVCEYIVSV